MTKEIWKFYKETNSMAWGHRIYYVSNYGRVKCNGKLYICPINKGYYYLFGIPLHRIVAKLFIPNPENKPFVDHIDTNRLNNRVDNLQWVTRTENNNNPLTIKHNRESSHKKSVIQYTLDNIFVVEYVSTMEAERQTKIPRSHIVDCCKHRRKSTGGYIWKYKEE